MRRSATQMKSSPSKKKADLREFKARNRHRPRMSELYRRAEAQTRNDQIKKTNAAGSKFALDSERLLHELQVHQVELELQNTELQEARNKTEVLLEKYTDLYDFAPVGYLSLDEQGHILEVNLTGATLLGVGRSRLLNQRLPSFIAPVNRPAFLDFLEQTFTGGEKQLCEATLLKADGTTFWASFHGASAISTNGPHKWCRVVISDLTALKQAEEALHQNEALFSTLIEQAPVGVYVVDSQLRLQQVNPNARPVFNKIHPLKDRDVSEIIHILWPDKVAGEIMGHFRHTLKTGKPYFSPAFSERRRDTGLQESYEWQLQRITLPAGKHGVVCFFNNITGRKRAEENQRRLEVLAASNQKLEKEIVRRKGVEKSLTKSEQHQSKLLAQSHRMQEQLQHLSRQILRAQEEERKRISRELHDVIAQTLTGINIRLATLKKGAGLKTKDFAQSIARTQHLVEKSVNIVHRFARELRPAVLDDLGLIPALHSFMKSFTTRTGVRTHLRAFVGVEKLDTAERTVLYRVAQEALTNVARHAQASRVEVHIQKLPRHISLEIIDNGKSFQVERVLRSHGKGRLGLLGMRERLEMVGGHFNIASSPGKGTTVTAKVPLGTSVRGGGGGRKNH